MVIIRDWKKKQYNHTMLSHIQKKAMLQCHIFAQQTHINTRKSTASMKEEKKHTQAAPWSLQANTISYTINSMCF
jgi:hypothetical protein